MAKTELLDPLGSDAAAKSLSNLVRHLERAVSGEQSQPLYGKSPNAAYERQKLKANFEHARALLLRLEHESSSIKVASRKQQVQTDLQAQREAIKKLQINVQELEKISYESEESEEESDDDDEYSYGPAIQASNSIDTEPSEAQEAASALANSLRSRNPDRKADSGSSQTETGRATGVSYQPEPASTSQIDPQPSSSFDQAFKEQITEQLVALAQELKGNSTRLGQSIEDENRGSLKRAMDGLDKGAEGMEAAGKRMGVLRRMTEGKGWWGRMMLYAWIAGLWVLLLIIVFVLPKLRF